MANPHRGELAFMAGGRPYTLQYTNDSLVELEEVLGKGIVAIVNEMQAWGKDPERLQLRWMRALFWAGLRKHHPDMDLRAAGELMTEVEGGVLGVMKLTGDAIGRAFQAPGAETKGEGPQGEPPSSNGTGTGSSSTTPPLASTQQASGASLLVN